MRAVTCARPQWANACSFFFERTRLNSWVLPRVFLAREASMPDAAAPACLVSSEPRTQLAQEAYLFTLTNEPSRAPQRHALSKREAGWRQSCDADMQGKGRRTQRTATTDDTRHAIAGHSLGLPEAIKLAPATDACAERHKTSTATLPEHS